MVIYFLINKAQSRGNVETRKAPQLALCTKGIDIKTKVNVSILETAAGVLNTRIAEGKKTVISTNLSIDELSNMYSQRTASRIAGSFTLLHIFGEDIRIKKKLEG